MPLVDEVRGLFRVQSGLISRASILILGGVLFGMGLGYRLPPALGERCLLFGGFGLVSFVALEIAATLWYQRKQADLVRLTSRVLDRRLRRLGLGRRPA
ncbi:MAG TPA: hypothetical protein VL475_02030 [Planctomycetaceae bacterium]|jgi:hypothetical protein|nr:hypothetical protein [Planctomycetaceae bacterium]